MWAALAIIAAMVGTVTVGSGTPLLSAAVTVLWIAGFAPAAVAMLRGRPATVATDAEQVATADA